MSGRYARQKVGWQVSNVIHVPGTRPIPCPRSFASQFHPHPRGQLARYFRDPLSLRDCILSSAWDMKNWKSVKITYSSSMSEALNSPETNIWSMINGVLLLVFPGPECTNPRYMTHSLLPCTSQNQGKFELRLAATGILGLSTHGSIIKTQDKPPNLQANYSCHWLPASFQRVQNPDPVQVVFKANNDVYTKNVFLDNLSNTWVRKLTKMNWMDGNMMDEL